MPNAESTKMQLDALLKENDRLSTDIRGMEGTAERYLAGGLALIGVSVAAGFDRIVVWYGLPVVLFGLMIMTFDKLRSIMWLGGYKCAVEEKINAIVDSKVAKWESFVRAQRKNGDVISTSLIAFVGGFQLFAAVYSLWRIWLTDGFWGCLGFLVVTGALGTVAVVAARKMLRAYDIAFQEAQILLDATK